MLAGLLGLVGPKRVKEESIEQFATRHFGAFILFACRVICFILSSFLCTNFAGEEVFSRLVDPFVSGVYAGNPKELSIDSTLSKV